MSEDGKNGKPVAVTIKLRAPIQHGQEMIAQLTVRPVTAKDLRSLQTKTGYELDTVLALASRLTGQPNPVIDQLTGDDLAEVIAVVSGFMPGSPPTGSGPSPT